MMCVYVVVIFCNNEKVIPPPRIPWFERGCQRTEWIVFAPGTDLPAVHSENGKP